MPNLFPEKLTCTQFNPFNSLKKIPLPLKEGLMILPLALSAVTVVYFSDKTIREYDCKEFSQENLECVRALAKLWGGVAGALVGCLTISLPICLLRLKERQEIPFKEQHPNAKAILKISEIRRNILLKKIQLGLDLKNHSKEEQKTISKEIDDLTALNFELENEQQKLWKLEENDKSQ